MGRDPAPVRRVAERRIPFRHQQPAEAHAVVENLETGVLLTRELHRPPAPGADDWLGRVPFHKIYTTTATGHEDNGGARSAGGGSFHMAR